MSKTLPLFDAQSRWLADPRTEFSAWLFSQAKLRSTRTRQIYGWQFAKYLHWLDKKHLLFHQVEKSHVRLFLASIDRENQTKKKHRYRYLRLLERTYANLERIGLMTTNPFQAVLAEQTIHGVNDETRFFTPAEQDLIVQLIHTRLQESENEGPSSWIQVRDAALVASILGGGAKVGEVVRLTVSCIKDGGKWIETFPANGKPGHRAKLFPFAITALADWIQLRASLGVPGNILFPAVKIGRQAEDGAPMSPATVFRRVQAFLLAAGVQGAIAKHSGHGSSPSRTCAQTLRNTYAALLFDQGAADDLVKQHLGMELEISVVRLRTSYDRVRNSEAL